MGKEFESVKLHAEGGKTMIYYLQQLDIQKTLELQKGSGSDSKMPQLEPPARAEAETGTAPATATSSGATPANPAVPDPHLDYTSPGLLTEEYLLDFFNQDGADMEWEISRARMHPMFETPYLPAVLLELFDTDEEDFNHWEIHASKKLRL